MNFEDITDIKFKKIDKDTIEFTKKTSLWCTLPYDNHSKGCPNYGKKNTCPPDAPYLEHEVKSYEHIYLLYLRFDFEMYRVIRGNEWINKGFPYTEKQLRCLLYYQPSIKRIIKNHIINKLFTLGSIYVLGCGSGLRLPFQKIVYSMEAVGINVFKTLKNNNIYHEIKPVNTTLFVNLICSSDIVFERKEKKEIKIMELI